MYKSNDKSKTMNYRMINFEVMTHTKEYCETNPELVEAIRHSIASQYMVADEDNIDQPIPDQVTTQYKVSGKRSFEAAKAYVGKKVAVLNYANNHSIGGAPFSAGAQEESLCRCSTLFPCLLAMERPFYQKHRDMYNAHAMDFMGNDDLIYTPDVVVFKSDERTDPIYPHLLPHEEWYPVNVITSAAPQLWSREAVPANYEDRIRSRIKKILDVAAKEGNEVVILGAWGCGAFRNPTEVVARIFAEQLKNYNFEIVEFALATHGNVDTSAFVRMLR